MAAGFRQRAAANERTNERIISDHRFPDAISVRFALETVACNNGIMRVWHVKLVGTVFVYGGTPRAEVLARHRWL